MDVCGTHSAVPSTTLTHTLLADGWPAMTHECTYSKETESADAPALICFHEHDHRKNACLFPSRPTAYQGHSTIQTANFRF